MATRPGIRCRGGVVAPKYVDKSESERDLRARRITRRANSPAVARAYVLTNVGGRRRTGAIEFN